jgi:hypothetical protein
MAEGVSKAEWGRTSSIIAMLVNVNRDPKKAPVKPSDFNPWVKKTVHRIENLGELRGFFVRDKVDQDEADQSVVGTMDALAVGGAGVLPEAEGVPENGN